MTRVLALDTHPIQYKAPLYRLLQQQHGYDVTVLYASDFSVKPYPDDEFGVEVAWDVDLLSGYRAVFGTQAAPGDRPDPQKLPCRKLLSTLVEVRPSAILLSHYSGRFGRESLAQLAGVPLPWVFFGDSTDHAMSRSRRKALVRDLALRGLYRRASALGYTGQHSLAHYRRLNVPAEKLVFVPYAVDSAPFSTTEEDRVRLRDACRRQHDIAQDRIVLMFSGKLSERKDPARVIHAVRRLSPELRDRITVAYLGAGELAGELKRLAAEAPHVDIRLIGFRNQSEISAYYHAADAVLLPSLYLETWGLVVNEALLHGTPCLVSDQVGSGPDLVLDGETGYSFAAGSEASLASAIERMVPLLGAEATRSACRNQVSRYSLDRRAAGLAEALATANPG